MRRCIVAECYGLLMLALFAGCTRAFFVRTLPRIHGAPGPVSINSSHPPAAAAVASAPRLPLSTQGRFIVDSQGSRVKLRCVSWSGAQEKWYVPSGLWAQHRSKIAAMAKHGGFNCIRLVWSLEMALRSSDGLAVVPKAALTANPDLVGKTPLQVLDAVIDAVAEQGLLVIIDNHSSDAIWCCGLQDGNGMWYTEKWSEQQWLQGWSLMAQRHANRSAVVGVGLRNEPRPTFVGGALRIPMWGVGGPSFDIALAYEKAAAQVLAARPTYLIFAQGLMAGRDLRLVRVRPLVLRKQWPLGKVIRGQLVYEVHEYPFLWGNFNFSDYDTYASKLDESWGYIARTNMAPLWLGEFGIGHDAASINSTWWQAVTRFIKDRDLDWSYWPLDGQQGPSRQQGAVETYGLLNKTWNGWAYSPLLQQLQRLM